MPWKNVAHTGFGHVAIEEIKVRCIYLHNLDPSKRCEFVKHSRCDENSELINYHHLLFCGIINPDFTNPDVIFFIFGMLIWLIVLFIILAVTVDEYFCPALGQISKLFSLSENLSGVTLLALGNSLPDILSSISSAAKGDTILMYNQILGSGMFVSCVVAGSIVITRPFYLHPYHFLRDSFFTLGTILWIQSTTKDEIVTVWEASSYIGIYILYLILVIGGFLLRGKLQDYDFQIDKKNDVDWAELRRRRSGLAYVEEIFASFAEKETRLSAEFDEDEDDDNEPETVKKLFKDCWISLNPIHNWEDMTVCDKIICIIKAPFIFILNLLIPVVCAGTKRNGWSKLLNCFHLLIYPTFFLYAAKLHEYKFNGVPMDSLSLPVGLMFAIIVFCTSQQNCPPPYHNVFAFVAFNMGILIIFRVVHEVVAVLTLFGTLAQIAPQTLGLTVLAWGNSLGDAVANIQIAKQGFQRMAFAGCFAGILARGGVMGPNCSVFFIMNLSFSIIYVFLTKFQARKSYGIFLISIYVEFLLFCVLCEMELIHPLGTDHQFVLDIFHISANKTKG